MVPRAVAATPARSAIWPAVAAMTLLQATVALAVFAPGVLAPLSGIGTFELGLFSTTVFAVGTVTTIWGGVWAGRFGSMRIAAFCALTVATGMALAALGGAGWSLIAVGLVLGLAFGPETPASSALLVRLVEERHRPFVFALRQTGNQLGAMLGSAVLPFIALAQGTAAGYAAVAGAALLASLLFLGLRPRYDRADGRVPPPIPVRQALRLLHTHPGLGRLAMVGMPYSAMQMALNMFLVSFAVQHLELGIAAGGMLLATAQAGGLIGRIGWGAIVTRGVSPRLVIAGLGLGMALAAIVTVTCGASLSSWLLPPLCFVFGLTASGWNGVYLAEVARLAPPGRGGEATGAVLVACYGGLVLGPLLFSAVASMAGLATGFAGIAALCTVACVLLVFDRSKGATHG